MDSKGSKVKRCQYSAEDMEAAVEDVKSGKRNTIEASKEHKVPISTLRDRLNGIHTGQYGRTTTLSADEESEIVRWIEDCAKLGQPLSKEQVIQAAIEISHLSSHVGRSFEDSGNICLSCD